jgi:hypothetical protein
MIAAGYASVRMKHWHTPACESQRIEPAPPVCKPTIQPPWKVLPWPVRVARTSPPQVIKIRVYSADMSSVGTMLDLFV